MGLEQARSRATTTAAVPVPEVGPAPPSRVVIADVQPQVDGGRYAVKRVVGEPVEVVATIIAEGHDVLAGRLLYRQVGEAAWRSVALAPEVNDRWVARFVPTAVGRWEYGVEAWVDHFATWRRGLARKVEAGQDVDVELREGVALLRAAAARAQGADAGWLTAQAGALGGDDPAARIAAALSPALAETMARHPDRDRAASLGVALPLVVERPLAAFGAWYECFPRSTSPEPGRHGTLRDLMARLPYVADMGFDVLYLPPIHPIGHTHRKGRNNTLVAQPGDPGSPWAIGSPAGGHTAIHPELGTLDDFDALVARAKDLHLEIALDLAFQCSPDHPWVHEHPEWFRHRPDGTIQYAENPPKKYQDIVPFDFEGPAWTALWAALRDVVLFWIDRGVTVFRVDNPHTKPFAFWEWLIAAVRERHPDTIFLSEAFTRPAVMQHLAKVGFSQSYTYFTWRNTRSELVTYLTELTQTPVREYMRPNLFANTPDILHEYLQTGGRGAHAIRLVLAATLAGSYGIYGPPFELAEATALPGTEEYQDSEKFEVRHWDLAAPHSLRPLVTLVNRIRRENPAFRNVRGLRFVPTDNEALLAYVRATPDGSNQVVVVVTLDPHHPQSGWIDLPLDPLGVAGDRTYQVEDLLGGGRYLWQGGRNFVSLDPRGLPAHVFRVHQHVRTERDFDYWL
jgi:starch synthase (maltosyl-transferring)